MGVLVGLGAGIGLVLIWSAFAVPRRAPRVRRWQTRVLDLLARAVLRHVSASAFFSRFAVRNCVLIMANSEARLVVRVNCAMNG